MIDLTEVLEYLEDRQDADCIGDPLEFVPNKEMRLAQEVREAIDELERLRATLMLIREKAMIDEVKDTYLSQFDGVGYIDSPSALELLDYAKRLRQRVAELGAANRWLPIETAPKNDSVLLYDSGTNTWIVGMWLDGDWVCVWDHEYLENYEVNPTHWQPLPQPPVAADSAQEKAT